MKCSSIIYLIFGLSKLIGFEYSHLRPAVIKIKFWFLCNCDPQWRVTLDELGGS